MTLFASRDPKDYDVTGPGNAAGRCPAKGPCKAFITIRAKNVGIMGDGVIDGRGGAKMLGQDYFVVGIGGEGGAERRASGRDSVQRSATDLGDERGRPDDVPDYAA